LTGLGHRVLIGASRKRFLAPLLAESADTAERDQPTAVISALAAESGVWGVRVHDAASTVAALDVWSAWSHGRDQNPRELEAPR
ncbi:MAG TPA: dihydropteroate synthase, partial [Terrimesophilobacter sp.]|nr:dihydropteroate synthase [Terrimesophilobacter sp.]